jgi:hypothetical protein
MVSVCSELAVARAAVSEHWETEFLSYPGSYARSSFVCVEKLELFPGSCAHSG